MTEQAYTGIVLCPCEGKLLSFIVCLVLFACKHLCGTGAHLVNDETMLALPPLLLTDLLVVVRFFFNCFSFSLVISILPVIVLIFSTFCFIV